MKLHVLGSWIFFFNFQAGWTSNLRFEMEIFQWQGREFHPTQQGQGEVLLVGGAFCHWFETYVQVKLKYLTRYGQRETLTPPPISSQETSTPKKWCGLALTKKEQRRFLKWTANIEFHVHILSLLSPKNPCSTKFHQLSWLSIHWWDNHPIFLTVNGFSFHIWPLASNFRFGKTTNEVELQGHPNHL